VHPEPQSVILTNTNLSCYYPNTNLNAGAAYVGLRPDGKYSKPPLYSNLYVYATGMEGVPMEYKIDLATNVYGGNLSPNSTTSWLDFDYAKNIGIAGNYYSGPPMMFEELPPNSVFGEHKVSLRIKATGQVIGQITITSECGSWF